LTAGNQIKGEKKTAEKKGVQRTNQKTGGGVTKLFCDSGPLKKEGDAYGGKCKERRTETGGEETPHLRNSQHPQKKETNKGGECVSRRIAH